MRRFALVLLGVPLVVAACGGGKSSAPPSDPVAAVRDASVKTVAAGSEQLGLDATIVSGSQTVELKGTGGFDTKAHRGSLHATLAAGSISGALEEVSQGTALYVKSDLLGAMLPAGKSWIRLELAQVAKSQGLNVSSLLSQDPSVALKQLQSLKDVTKVGSEQVGGVATTHYHATIDAAKLPTVVKGGTGEYDVWVGDDGYVHRVRATINSKGSKATVTTSFSGYGDKVTVDVPPASQVYDGTGNAIPGLGG